ncbi:hypothetical protein V6N13_098340 [Hibiscus sabdariffa]
MGSEIEDYAVRGEFCPLPHMASVDLMRLVTMEETEYVFRSMDPFKAPRVDGFHTCFFQKNWAVVHGRNLGPLVNWVTDPTLLGEPIPIALLMDTDGCWKWEELEELLLESILQHLLAVKPPLGDNGCDMPGWKWSETRHFSIRSASNHEGPGESTLAHCCNNRCGVCAAHSESLDHIFRWCM